MKKRIALLLATLLCMVACVGSDLAFAAASAGQESEQIVLHYMHTNNPEAKDAKSLGQALAIKMFEEQNPNVKIDAEYLASDVHDTKLRTMIAANEVPDVFTLLGSLMGNVVGNDLIMPWNDVLDADPEWRDNIHPGIYKQYTMDGTIYAVTDIYQSTAIVFYNSAIFEECGITSFPETEADFLAAAKILRDNGYTPLTFGNKDKWPFESCFFSTWGDRFTGSDWFESLKDDTGAKFTDPEFVAALASVQNWAQSDVFNKDMNSLDLDQGRSLYYNGKAAIINEGAWFISSLVATAPKEIVDATKLAKLPMPEGGKGDPNSWSAGGGLGFAVSSSLSDAEKEAAVKFVKCLVSAEVAGLMAENNGTPSVLHYDYDTSKVSPLAVEYNKMAAELAGTKVYDVDLTSTVIEDMKSGLQELIIGTITPEELASRLQTLQDAA